MVRIYEVSLPPTRLERIQAALAVPLIRLGEKMRNHPTATRVALLILAAEPLIYQWFGVEALIYTSFLAGFISLAFFGSWWVQFHSERRSENRRLSHL